MASGNWTLLNDTRTLILQGNLKTGDTWKVALFAGAAASASSTLFSGLTGEVSTTNTGYTTGGAAVTLSLSGTTSVLMYFAANPTWTAGSAGLAAQQAVLYDVTSGYILGYVLLDSGGATVTTTSGQTLTVADSSSNPIETFA